jgi:hypothetical protein
MKRTALLFSTILLTAMIAASGIVLAQQGGGRGPGWGMGQDMMGPGWGRGMMGGDWGNGRRGMMGGGCPMIAFGDDGETTTFIDGRLAFLKAELKITDAQKAAWDGYAKALQDNLETMKSMHQLMRTAFDAETPVERLDSRIAAMETRLNALKDMQPALSTLYDALDASQRESADEMLTVMGCMM